jgi:phage shock protein A
MLQEETDLTMRLALLRDEELYFRDQCRLLLEQGDEDRAMEFDDLANEVADEIQNLTGV